MLYSYNIVNIHDVMMPHRIAVPRSPTGRRRERERAREGEREKAREGERKREQEKERERVQEKDRKSVV